MTQKLINHNKESVADFKKRFDAIKKSLPRGPIDDEWLKRQGAVDVTHDRQGLGITFLLGKKQP